jgi:Flp pilus assembly protein TadG
MRKLMLWRRAREEEGVTAIIVALVLVALFGMLVLVVDVGGLLLKRRAMVNASDAAALAAAKSCIEADSYTAEGAADTWAGQNAAGVQTGSTNITQISGCLDDAPNGYVSVRYASDQQLFFAPVLGFGNSNPVRTAATAIWGPPGALNPMPIVVYANAFNSCKLDQDPIPGVPCYVWEDNNNTQGPQSGFGFLDLRTDNPANYGWDSVPGAACSDPGGAVTNWINSYLVGEFPDLPLNYPGATYVCRASGNRQSAWTALERLVGQILYFPLNRCDAVLPGGSYGQVDASGAEIACGSTPHQYDIIGFVALRLSHIYSPLEARGTGGTCSKDFQPFDVDGDIATGQTFTLNAFGSFNSCFTGTPDAIGDLKISPKKGLDYTMCAAGQLTGCDYRYDSSSRTVTWMRASTVTTGNQEADDDLHVSFTWQNGGPCGIPPAGTNSGHCLVVDYVDLQVGGSRPGEGDPNSNIRAYKLCDPAIAGSCDPIQVP